MASRSDKWPRWLRSSKKFAADSELESKAVFCPRLEPFVEFDLQKRQPNVLGVKQWHGRRKGRGNETHVGMIEAMEHPHLAP